MIHNYRIKSKDKVMPERTRPQLQRVRLLPGTPFFDGQQNMLEFLKKQDVGSLLYNFRKASGLPVSGAEPMTGWDAEECKLKGHTTGHFMSAFSLAYAVSGDEVFKNKLSELVSGLRKCQKAFEKSGKTKPGFLSAYDEEQFDLLEQLTKYPEIWAPYYTLDKIMSGLLDAYELAGVRSAKGVLIPLGDWVYERLSRVQADLRSKMWDTYIAGEFGFMISTMVRLYRISGKKEHLETAKMFENARLFDQMRDGRDELDSMHANQHIPQICGALELYAATGEQEYLRIAANFEKTVTEHHCYAIGGTGEEERFRAADSECGFLSEKTAESCASVNMLRLTSKLYEYEQTLHPGLMDYYELTLFNHILMSYSHSPDGGTTYFMPLAPGSSKHYETEENSCCHGTGLESRFRYMTDIFSYEGSGEDSVVRVELPISSVLDDDEKLTVVFTEDGTLSVTAWSDMKRSLEIRIPAWARQDFSDADDGYLKIGRLRSGESVTFSLPMKVRRLSTSSDDGYYNLAWGPYLLAAVSDSGSFLSPDPDEVSDDTIDGLRHVFRAGEMRLEPVHRIDREKYHVYFRK